MFLINIIGFLLVVLIELCIRAFLGMLFFNWFVPNAFNTTFHMTFWQSLVAAVVIGAFAPFASRSSCECKTK